MERSELHADTSGRVELSAGAYTFTATLKKPVSGSGGTQD